MVFDIKSLFPLILTGIDILAAGVYFWHKDIPRTIYWLSAGVLTLTTLFMK